MKRALLLLAVVSLSCSPSPTEPELKIVDCNSQCSGVVAVVNQADVVAAQLRGLARVRAAVEAGKLSNRGHFSAWGNAPSVEYAPCYWWSVSNRDCAWSQAFPSLWSIRVSTLVPSGKVQQEVEARAEWETINCTLDKIGHPELFDKFSGVL